MRRFEIPIALALCAWILLPLLLAMALPGQARDIRLVLSTKGSRRLLQIHGPPHSEVLLVTGSELGPYYLPPPVAGMVNPAQPSMDGTPPDIRWSGELDNSGRAEIDITNIPSGLKAAVHVQVVGMGPVGGERRWITSDTWHLAPDGDWTASASLAVRRNMAWAAVGLGAVFALWAWWRLRNTGFALPNRLRNALAWLLIAVPGAVAATGVQWSRPAPALESSAQKLVDHYGSRMQEFIGALETAASKGERILFVLGPGGERLILFHARWLAPSLKIDAAPLHALERFDLSQYGIVVVTPPTASWGGIGAWLQTKDFTVFRRP
jgi:hypothetical protein